LSRAGSRRCSTAATFKKPRRIIGAHAGALTLAAFVAGCGGEVATAPPGTGFGLRLVAFASDRNGSFDIFLYDLEGLFQYALPNLNDTAAVDRNPSLGSDGQVLAFATNRTSGMGDFDIRIYDLLGGVLASTPAINTPAREDEPAFTGNALSLFFVRDTLGDRRIRMFYGIDNRYIPLPGLSASPGSNDWAPAPNNTGSLVAFVSDRNGSPDVLVYDAGGDSLLNLPDLASDSTDTEPSLTPDGRYLAFASTRPGGSGGFDIYLYDLQTRAFITLSASVNTAMHERNPTVSPSGNVLSYESNRADGLGGYDIWNHDRPSGTTGQGTNLDSTSDDVQPSIKWP
jgi:Tol biopolymer transport system component